MLPLLHLVLYNPQTSYEVQMKNTTSKWYKKFPDVETYYYFFQEGILVPELREGDLLLIPGKETWIPGLLDKTIKALAFFDRNRYRGLLRSNISSIIDLDALSSVFPGPMSYGSSLLNDIYDCSGTNIVLGWNVWDCLMKHVRDVDYRLDEDRAISRLLNAKWGPPAQIGSLSFEGPPTRASYPITTYRHKTANRWQDAIAMEKDICKLSQFRRLKQSLPIQVLKLRCGQVDITVQVRLKAHLEKKEITLPLLPHNLVKFLGLPPQHDPNEFVYVSWADDTVELLGDTASFEENAGVLLLTKWG